jgi:hypothetical protein
MNNTQKSWRGKPTTNLVNPLWSAWTIDGSGQGSIGTRTILSSYHCRIDDVNQNTRQSIYISGVSANTTYTFSVKYKKIFGTPTLRFQIQAYNGETFISGMTFATTAQLGITDIDDWQTASITLTTPSSTTRVVWFMQDGDDYVTYTHSFELKEPQMEEGSIVSSFVDGTRSSTQGLLDLTENRSLTPTNIIYNTDGTFSFNGSSWFDLDSTDIITGTQAFAVEAWYTTTGVTADEIFGNYGSGSTSNTLWISGRYGMWINSSVYFPGAPLGAGTYHIVATRSSAGDVFLYKNGVLVNTGSLPASIATTFNFRIGADVNGGGEPFTGNIHSVKVYNKLLTATEVTQNFNSQRDRYGL